MRIIEKITTVTKNKAIIKSVIGFILFMAILGKVFCNTTYLFRNTGQDRINIVGIENETLDMVYIGGSAAFVYWEPLKAWNDCGFTSYSYATNTVQVENIKAYLKEVRTTQNPELYVIGVRAFQYYSDEQVEVGLRNGTDSMDLTSFARYELLNDYFNHRNITEDTDILSYYLDIAKYHTNTENLGSSLAWKYIHNNGISPNKGWEWIDSYAYLDEPSDFETDERAELPENAKKVLIDILEYCKTETLNVLFVVCPYYITKEDQKKYNMIGDIIDQYGFHYLNANEYYDAMELDFSTDFYNKNHVNLFGAAKYTEFLENYIITHYNMPDHRNDKHFSSWHDDYIRFAEEEKIHAKTVTDLRLNTEKGLTLAEQMKLSTNLSEWYELVDDRRYIMLIAVHDNIVWPENVSDQKIINCWEITADSQRQIRTVNNSSVLYSNATDKTLTNDGVLGIWGNVPYCISIEDNASSITVNGEEMSLNQSGINVAVFDNNYRRIVDSVALRCEDDGNMHIYRE